MALDREYKIGARSRRCQACSREFGIGDEYLSTVVETAEEDRLSRQDFCPACWKPEAQPYFSFWKTRVPEPESADRKGPPLVDLARLMQLFEHLAESPDEQARRFRYVLALVLMRKRRLRVVESRRGRGGKGDVLTLRETGSERRHVVEAPGISDDEIRSVADRLREILDMPEKWDQVSTVEAEAPPAGGPEGTRAAADDDSTDKNSDEDNPKEEDAALKHREDEFVNDEDEEFEEEEEKDDEDGDEDDEELDDDEDEDDEFDDDEDDDEDRDA